MVQISKSDTERLGELKKTVENSREYFKANIDRYNTFMSFVFKSSIPDAVGAALAQIDMPNIEFNILESLVSMQRGEFAKQQPSLEVRAADGIPLSQLTPQFTQTIDVLEAHLRAIFFDGTNDMLLYNIYTDILAGGFSAAKVSTKYTNWKSFEQKICVERVFSPTMCIWDPLAQESHKGDGDFCGEIYALTEEQFKHQFGDERLEGMTYTRSLGGFGWSYLNGKEKIVLVCNYFEKEKKKATLYKLSNGHSVIKEDYEKFLKEWQERGILAQPPAIIESRKTEIDTITRQRFCETGLIEKPKKTDFAFLPLIYVDGNSMMISDGDTSTQMSRPYVYHAMGIQRLKNLAGQSLANELENMMQSKLIAAVEAVPEKYQDAYKNYQKADVILYNHFHKGNPEVPLPPPREVVRTPIPPQIAETFRMSDEMTQAIIGNYNASQNIGRSDMSGVAVFRNALQTSISSSPYGVGLIKALNRIAEVVVDLIPKYYRTPRSLPIVLPNGKRETFVINQAGSLYMNYDPHSLQVKVDTGVNFTMQKEIALQTIEGLTKSMPNFAEFFSKMGLQTLLDNIDIRGIDGLKEKAEEFEKEQEAQQQQAQQLQQLQTQAMVAELKKKIGSPTPEQVQVMAIQQKSQIDNANINIKEREAETNFLEVMSKIRAQGVDQELKKAEIDAENTRSAIESAVTISQHIHEVKQAEKENRNESNDSVA